MVSRGWPDRPEHGWAARLRGSHLHEETTIDAANAFIHAVVGTPWIPLAIFAFVLLDAFFPPVPSESLVIAAAAAAVSVGQPNIVLVILSAAAGAFAGDNLTYAIGRAIRIDRFAWMRGRRTQRALQAAAHGLARRPASVLLTARYVPIGRVAVNLMAGASSFPRKRFVGFTAVTGTLWALYSVGIGLLAGHWLHGNAFLGMVVGIALGLATGLLIDLVLRLVHRRAERIIRRRQPAASRGLEAE